MSRALGGERFCMAQLPTQSQFGDYSDWPGRDVLDSGGERLGGVRDGVLRCHTIMRDGFVRDTVNYSFTMRDWSVTKVSILKLLQERTAVVSPVLREVLSEPS